MATMTTPADLTLSILTSDLDANQFYKAKTPAQYGDAIREAADNLPGGVAWHINPNFACICYTQPSGAPGEFCINRK